MYVELKMLPIEIVDRHGCKTICKQRCLESTSGAVYEIGRELKEALFGIIIIIIIIIVIIIILNTCNKVMYIMHVYYIN